MTAFRIANHSDSLLGLSGEPMQKSRHLRDQHLVEAAAISIIFFWLLWILPYFFTNRNGLQIDSTLVLVALVPFIIWLIVSGRIKEITGPGGWGLKLNDIAQRRAFPDDKISPEPFQVIPKQAFSNKTFRDLQARHPNILSFDISREN